VFWIERERDVDGGEERDFPLMGASDFFIRRGENNVLLSYFGLDDIRTIGCRGIVSGLVTRYFGSKGRSGGLGPPIIHFIRRMSSNSCSALGKDEGGGGDVKFRRICSIRPFFLSVLKFKYIYRSVRREMTFPLTSKLLVCPSLSRACSRVSHLLLDL